MREHADLDGKIHLVKEREDSEDYTRAMSRSKLGKHNDRVKAQKSQTQSTLSFSSVGEHLVQGAKNIIRTLTGSTDNSNPDVQEVSGLDDDPYEGEQPFEESESAPGRKGSKRRNDGNDSDEYVPSDDENREDRRGPHRDTR